MTSEDHRDRVLDWLAQQCPDFRCPACGHKEWGVCGLTDDETPVPRICVGCPNCGFVAHFCARTLGLSSGS